MKKYTRRLKIYTHYSPGKYKKDCKVPYIRLRGKWLEQAGFQVGKPILVVVNKQKLVILFRKCYNE
ncbi:type I addiction module toxin, SymE family [Apibacter muscae]|uniref:Type I addiction module toxin, SymE family n=1 Tax=Apibacter muscae TaxID=2509004 RepID=A0A563DC35_9FLAO|nr:SymE family type I addiction module toxin [Apibacter muscae]TWP27776.1 type I addiction module toxin, SymE family [Apibacter muscae]